MSNPTAHWHIFPTADALAVSFAQTISRRLREAIDVRGSALLAVSGGTTPRHFFQVLSKQQLDWRRVIITLVDERFVELTSPRSNQGLVEQFLLQGPAEAARFVPLYRQASDAADAIRESEEELEKMRWPLDVAVLGMGTDGHTASFFPDAPNLRDLIDPERDGILRMVLAPSAGETRMSLSLRRIISARYIALHIEGAPKRAVLETALRPGNRLPVSAVFDHCRQPVEIFWAP
jgi:6-phosphogluconolactonase